MEREAWLQRVIDCLILDRGGCRLSAQLGAFQLQRPSSETSRVRGQRSPCLHSMPTRSSFDIASIDPRKRRCGRGHARRERAISSIMPTSGPIFGVRGFRRRKSARRLAETSDPVAKRYRHAGAEGGLALPRQKAGHSRYVRNDGVDGYAAESVHLRTEWLLQRGPQPRAITSSTICLSMKIALRSSRSSAPMTFGKKQRCSRRSALGRPVQQDLLQRLQSNAEIQQ